jgi:hypothetical protein
MNKMQIDRRGMLRLLGASPLAGRTLLEDSKLALSRVGPASMDWAGSPAHLDIPGSPKEFARLVDWLRELGDKEVRKEAHEVHALDPDIVEMRSLSLQAKFRV